MTKTFEGEISFGPFRMDGLNARLLCGDRPVALTPKAFDLLHHLATRPQRLVTKEELLAAVWPDVIVSDASIKVCVREIRKALDDGAKTPTYIETVHRRGYRFIGIGAAVSPEADTRSSRASAATAIITGDNTAAGGKSSPAHPIVGRDPEIDELTKCFQLARSGERQCVFISSGPGGGKTALAETFIRKLAAETRGANAPVILAGHCFEQFGTSEPYMPVWEAIRRLTHAQPSQVLTTLLARHADAYAASQPAAQTAAPHPSAGSDPRGTSKRLLREMAEAIEALADEAPVILLLEDVHWADYSTIDLLSALARRREPAKLMVIATYRPTEILAADHPLRGVVQGLLTARLAHEIVLDFLDVSAVAEFLTARFPGSRLPDALILRLHQRTDGHPLFLVHLVEDLIEQGVIADQGGTWRLHCADADAPESADDGEATGWLAVLETQIPSTVRAMIELHLERLDRPTREMLEAAAVAGVEFSAAAVAAALAVDVVHAEQACDELARRHRFLEPRGIVEWPNGAAAICYRFVHELYHNVVYEQVPLARRARMHQLLGVGLESAWAGRAAEEAAGLAMHFEMGRDWPRAVKYLRYAAHAAARHYAHREAVHYLYRALAALDRLPDSERSEHELDVLKHLGVNLQVTSGFAASEVETVYTRAYALCRSSGDVARTFPVLWGIWLFHKVRSNLLKACNMCDELLAMALASGDPALLLQAHQAMCVTYLCLGLPDITRDHLEQATAIYDPDLHAANTITFGQDPGVATSAFGSVALWLLGRPKDALAASEHSLHLARRLDQPSSLALAMHFAAMLHQFRGDVGATGQWAQSAIDLAAAEGFSFWLAGGLVMRGWAQVVRSCAGDAADAEAGIAEIRRGLEAWLATGSRTYHAYYLGLLADALLRLGRYSEAMTALDEALAVAQSLPEGLYEAELHRLRGRCLLQTSPDSTIEALECFRRALATARAQGARWFEWRAATDLAGVLRRSGEVQEAEDLLAMSGPSVDLPNAQATNVH